VREKALFFNTEVDREEKIRSTLADPGRSRDWLVEGVHAFLDWP
jgi:hypothetical protein